MRDDHLYLTDIIEAANAIQDFVAGHTDESFEQNALVRSAVLQQLTIIGEAASRLTPDIRKRHSDIEWSDAIAFRNRVVHAYFSIVWSIVWDTATGNVPDLARQIAAILAENESTAESES